MLVNYLIVLEILKGGNLKIEFYLCENFHFAFMQLVDALTETLKK